MSWDLCVCIPSRIALQAALPPRPYSLETNRFKSQLPLHVQNTRPSYLVHLPSPIFPLQYPPRSHVRGVRPPPLIGSHSPVAEPRLATQLVEGPATLLSPVLSSLGNNALSVQKRTDFEASDLCSSLWMFSSSVTGTCIVVFGLISE